MSARAWIIILILLALSGLTFCWLQDDGGEARVVVEIVGLSDTAVSTLRCYRADRPGVPLWKHDVGRGVFHVERVVPGDTEIVLVVARTAETPSRKQSLTVGASELRHVRFDYSDTPSCRVIIEGVPDEIFDEAVIVATFAVDTLTIGADKSVECRVDEGRSTVVAGERGDLFSVALDGRPRIRLGGPAGEEFFSISSSTVVVRPSSPTVFLRGTLSGRVVRPLAAMTESGPVVSRSGLIVLAVGEGEKVGLADIAGNHGMWSGRPTGDIEYVPLRAPTSSLTLRCGVGAPAVTVFGPEPEARSTQHWQAGDPRYRRVAFDGGSATLQPLPPGTYSIRWWDQGRGHSHVVDRVSISDGQDLIVELDPGPLERWRYEVDGDSLRGVLAHLGISMDEFAGRIGASSLSSVGNDLVVDSWGALPELVLSGHPSVLTPIPLVEASRSGRSVRLTVDVNRLRMWEVAVRGGSGHFSVGADTSTLGAWVGRGGALRVVSDDRSRMLLSVWKIEQGHSLHGIVDVAVASVVEIDGAGRWVDIGVVGNGSSADVLVECGGVQQYVGVVGSSQTGKNFKIWTSKYLDRLILRGRGGSGEIDLDAPFEPIERVELQW